MAVVCLISSSISAQNASQSVWCVDTSQPELSSLPDVTTPAKKDMAKAMAAALTSQNFDPKVCQHIIETLPPLPEVSEAQINFVGDDQLTLLGVAAGHLLKITSIQAATAAMLPMIQGIKIDNELVLENAAFAEMKRAAEIGNRCFEQEIKDTIDKINSLKAKAADFDQPMLSELCITPRDLIIRAALEYRGSQSIDQLLNSLGAERNPPESAGQDFRTASSVREWMNDSYEAGRIATPPGLQNGITVTYIAEASGDLFRPCDASSIDPLPFCNAAEGKEAPQIEAGED